MCTCLAQDVMGVWALIRHVTTFPVGLPDAEREATIAAGNRLGRESGLQEMLDVMAGEVKARYMPDEPGEAYAVACPKNEQDREDRFNEAAFASAAAERSRGEGS